MQTALPVLKPYPVLAPVLPVTDQCERLLEERMVRMGYSEMSLLNVAIGRS